MKGGGNWWSGDALTTGFIGETRLPFPPESFEGAKGALKEVPGRAVLLPTFI